MIIVITIIKIPIILIKIMVKNGESQFLIYSLEVDKDSTSNGQ